MLFVALGTTALTVVSSWLSAPTTSYSPVSAIGPDYRAAEAPPLNTVAEARLANYETSYRSIGHDGGEGRRCEQLATAYGTLSKSDLIAAQRGRFATSERTDEIQEGARCQGAISDSDRRFEAVSEAARLADRQTASGAAFQRVDLAIKNLTEFDRSRSRYTADASVIAKAQSIADADMASDGRIADLAKSDR